MPNATIADCDDVRACLTGGDGLNYDPATGDFDLCLSPAANNAAVIDASGCLFVQTGAATVTAGCGLTGTGAPASPLTVDTGAWPYACDIAAQGGVVACDPATGQLHSEPRSRSRMQTIFFDQDYANITVPAAANQFVARVEGNFTNPDPCRAATVIAMQEMEFTLNLPPNAGAEYGYDGPDEMVFHINRGATAENGFHIQASKVVNRGTIAPGATATYGFDALIGRGSNGATYSSLQGILRILMVTA